MTHADPIVALPDAVVAPSADADPVVPSVAARRGTSRIMIVDDELIDVKLVRKYLKMAGYADFITTTDPTQAMELIRRETPDILLLDIVMPGVTGMEILQQLRAESASRYLPVIVLSAASTAETKRQALLLGATDFLNKPPNFTELSARVRNALTIKSYHDQLADYAHDLEQRIQDRTAELATSRTELIQCLARAAECRTDLTKQHSVRVSGYAAVIARGMGLDDQTVEAIENASLLHDVGKMGLPDSILGRADRPTPEEADLLKRHHVRLPRAGRTMSHEESSALMAHTIAGSRIMAVGQSRLLKMAAMIAMTHHEKWDGSGYPLGLQGERIPLESRIVAVANAFDRLSTKQSYRMPFSAEECMAILSDAAGTHFDPKVLEGLLRNWPEILQVQAGYSGGREQPDPPAANIGAG